MSIVTSTDREAFDEIVRSAQFAPGDFVLTETIIPVALKLTGDPIAGWVTVRRGSHARTYSAGPGYDWISWFTRDLDFGVFGDRAGNGSGRTGAGLE